MNRQPPPNASGQPPSRAPPQNRSPQGAPASPYASPGYRPQQYNANQGQPHANHGRPSQYGFGGQYTGYVPHAAAPPAAGGAGSGRFGAYNASPAGSPVPPAAKTPTPAGLGSKSSSPGAASVHSGVASPSTASSPANSRQETPTVTGPESILEKSKRDFPNMAEKTSATAVRTRKTYEDSSRWLKQMQQRNLMPSAAPQQQQKHQSIRQKFSHLAYEQRAPPQMQPGMMNRGMMPNQMHPAMMNGQFGQPMMPNQMQGQMMGGPMPGQPMGGPQMHGRMPQPMPGQMPMMNGQFGQPMLNQFGQPVMGNASMANQFRQQQAAMQRAPARKASALEDEESEDDMSDSDNYDPQEAAEFDARLSNFLNTASAEAIADVSTQPIENVQALVKKRPFSTLAQAARVDVALPKDESGTDGEDDGKKRRRGAARKSAGLKIIDAARTTLRGYEAVDSLIKECSRLGKLVHQGIDKWQLNEETLQATGPTFFKDQPASSSEGTVLKNYQQVGINWSNSSYEEKSSCILADEMGLGKTLQVIAFLAHLKERGEQGPHLVVCPASTLENWSREFAKFCPSFRIEAYYGGQPERREIRESIYEHPDSFDVMVTTYNLATGQKQDVGFSKSMGFNVVVYDEGHLSKNSQSERYNKLMKLKAKFRVSLTGTPLQNNLRELVSLLSFILPRLFTENRDDLLEVFRFRAKATAGESEKSRDDSLSEQRIRKAKTMMQPFILRRRKEQVLQHLPPKSHEVEFCIMTDMQRTIYERELKRNKKDIRTAKNEVDTLTGGTKKAQKAAGKQLDNVLMQSRKAALHPSSFREIYTDAKLKKMAKAIMDEDVYKEANQTYIFEDMQVMNDFELDRSCRKFPVTSGEYISADEHFTDSGKAQKLVDMLNDMLQLKKPEAERDELSNRVSLFSQFTLMLDISQRVSDILGVKYLRMDGQTPVEARQDMIDQFHDDTDIKVFLSSTKAGGFGINLAVANRVIIFDSSFNPHDDKQAEDRAHRVGQTRPVEVTRLITKDTIEENISELANTKSALDKQVSEETGSDDEDEIDTEKEAYVAGQSLGKGGDDDDDDDGDDNESEGEHGSDSEDDEDAKPAKKNGKSAAENSPVKGKNGTTDATNEEPAPPRRRGRPPKSAAKPPPPKVDLSDDEDEEDEDDDFDSDDEDSKPRRKTRRMMREAAAPPSRTRRARRG